MMITGQMDVSENADGSLTRYYSASAFEKDDKIVIDVTAK